MRTWVFAIVMMLAVFAAPAATPARAVENSQGIAELELQRSRNGLLLVDVMINGTGPYPFVLDTGAGATILDTQLVEELGLTSTGRLITVHGVVGTSEMPAYVGAQLGVGGFSVTPDLVLAHELSLDRARGILGSDVLTRYAVEIDGIENVLRLHAGNYRPPRRADVVRVRMTVDQYGLPYVRIRVNHKRMTALLDTGFNGVILRPEAAREARVIMRRSDTDVRDIADDDASVDHFGRARLRLGDAQWPVFAMLVLDATVFERLVGEDPADAIIGADLFAGAVLVLDYEDRFVYIVQEEARRWRS